MNNHIVDAAHASDREASLPAEDDPPPKTLAPRNRSATGEPIHRRYRSLRRRFFDTYIESTLRIAISAITVSCAEGRTRDDLLRDVYR